MSKEDEDKHRENHMGTEDEDKHRENHMGTEDEDKQNTICVGHHYAETNTNNVNMSPPTFNWR